MVSYGDIIFVWRPLSSNLKKSPFLIWKLLDRNRSKRKFLYLFHSSKSYPITSSKIDGNWHFYYSYFKLLPPGIRVGSIWISDPIFPLEFLQPKEKESRNDTDIGKIKPGSKNPIFSKCVQRGLRVNILVIRGIERPMAFSPFYSWMSFCTLKRTKCPNCSKTIPLLPFLEVTDLVMIPLRVYDGTCPK